MLHHGPEATRHQVLEHCDSLLIVAIRVQPLGERGMARFAQEVETRSRHGPGMNENRHLPGDRKLGAGSCVAVRWIRGQPI
jgi:hypothetical protein